jgi:TolA-binding protein
MANDLRDLQNTLARLSAGSREHQNRLQALDRRVTELAARLSPEVSTPPGFAPSAGSGLPPPTRSATATSAEELYRLGTAQREAGDSLGAQLVLSELIATYPTHPLRERAQFVVGDILYAEKNYHGARAEFQGVLAAVPYGSSTPEALLKIGLCERGLRNEAAARGVWQRLVKEYARSAAADTARALLRAGGAR